MVNQLRPWTPAAFDPSPFLAPPLEQLIPAAAMSIRHLGIVDHDAFKLLIIKSRLTPQSIRVDARLPLGDMDLGLLWAACDVYGIAGLEVVLPDGFAFSVALGAEDLAALEPVRKQVNIVASLASIGNHIGALIDEEYGPWVGLGLGAAAGIALVALLSSRKSAA